MSKLEDLYTTAEVAEHYRVVEGTVHRWVRAGRIKCINLGGGRSGPYVFRREDLEAFEERGRRGGNGA